MSTGKIELSVGAVKIANKYEIFTEEEIDAINNKIPELDGRVGVIEDEIEEVNSSLDNKMNKNEILSMANMGQDVKEAMTGGSVAVVGKGMVNYDNLAKDLSSIFTAEREVENKIFLTTNDFTLINCNPIEIITEGNSHNLIMSGCEVGFFGGAILSEITSNTYKFKIPTANLSRNIWYIYKQEGSYIYIAQFYKTTSVPLMKLGTSTTNSVTTLETKTMPKTVSEGEEITIIVEGNVQKIYSNETLLLTLDDCNAIGIADGRNSQGSQIVRCIDFCYTETLKELAIDSKNTRYKGQNLEIVIDSFLNNQNIVKNSFLNNKKVIFMGDSLTNNVGTYTSKPYFKWLEEWYNLTIYVDGQNGSSIRDNTSDSSRAMCNRYTKLPDDYDIVIVFGGTNDWNANTLGALGSFGDTDVHTFYGAMKTLCEGLIKKYPNKLIVFMLPFKHWKGGSRPINDAMIEVLQDNGIPYIDYYAVGGINPNISEHVSQYMLSDNIHFNEAGHKLIAERLDGFLNSLKIN